MKTLRTSPARTLACLMAFVSALVVTCAASAQTRIPILVTKPDSTRAVALESPTMLSEPFRPTSAISWGGDSRTRIMLFAMNLDAYVDASEIKAEAEDAAHVHYLLAVEHVDRVPEINGLFRLIVALDTGIAEGAGDILVSITVNRAQSNRVRVGIGHVGGGAADDADSGPTSFPPYSISGHITSNGAPLSGVLVVLSGTEQRTFTTDANGLYSFTVNSIGNYVVTPSKDFYAFTPNGKSLGLVGGNRILNFEAARMFLVSGTVRDDSGQPLRDVLFTLNGEAKGMTDAAGNYSLAGVFKGSTINLSKPNYSFSPPGMVFSNINGDQVLNFNARSLLTTISGTVTAGGVGVAGVQISLTGSQTATTVTDTRGKYSFANLPRSGNYTVTPSKVNYSFGPTASLFPQPGPAETANFIPTPNVYNISGNLTDDGKGVAGVTVSLSGSAALSTQTDANGDFSFAKLPAEGNYIITPTETDALTFAAQACYTLSANQQLAFQGARKTQAITGDTSVSGSVFDENGNPLAGVTVTIDGGQQVTNAQGQYSFPSLSADKTYTLVAGATNVYSFAAQKPGGVNGAGQLDFRGTRKIYTVGGRLTDGTLPVPGAKVNITGGWTQMTDSTGAFSFAVQAGFNYAVQVMPTSFYTYAPVSVGPLTGNTTVNIPDGTLRSYAISGRITDGSTPLGHILLLLNSTDGLVNRVSETGDDGTYSFDNLPAKLNYVTSVNNDLFYTFPQPPTQEGLDSNRTINLTGTPRRYTISGRVIDQQSAPVGSVTVTLTDIANNTVTTFTDAGGNYSFPNLPCGNYYMVSVSKTKYLFTPDYKQFDHLLADGKADFVGNQTYLISGRITGAAGEPAPGITMNLTGPQNLKAATDLNGFYYFTLTQPGGYTLVPSKEQGFYSFTPGSQNLNVAGDLSCNFAAVFVSPTSPLHVLEFNGQQQSVYYGYFWPYDVDLGHFFWEFWAMPMEGDANRYLLSDGHGGAHALLFGFSVKDDLKRYSLSGNVFDSATGRSVDFQSAEGPAPGEWAYVAVGWDGHNIITYYDGVPVGKSEFTGARRSTPPDWGGGPLYIGGSDHSNFVGRIAQVRGFEGANPRENAAEASFAPQSIFTLDGNLLSYFFTPDTLVADLGFGYNGGPHTGQLFNGPAFVLDPTAPDFTNAKNPGHVNAPVDAPPAPPAGALVFDSFSRNNATYILGGVGGLGVTESGVRGPLTWKTNQADVTQPQPFGILSGHGVLLADAACVAWIDAGSNNVQVQSLRTRGTGGAGFNTGIAFRVADAQNYFFAYTDGEIGSTLNVGYYASGNLVKLGTNIAMPDSWWTLKVVTSAAGLIEVYADDTLVYSTTNTKMSQNTGAGIYNSGPGRALTNRWDNFTVAPIP
jgi:hypothetical protein